MNPPSARRPLTPPERACWSRMIRQGVSTAFADRALRCAVALLGAPYRIVDAAVAWRERGARRSRAPAACRVGIHRARLSRRTGVHAARRSALRHGGGREQEYWKEGESEAFHRRAFRDAPTSDGRLFGRNGAGRTTVPCWSWPKTRRLSQTPFCYARRARRAAPPVSSNNATQSPIGMK
jgi:hypothetical protein